MTKLITIFLVLLANQVFGQTTISASIWLPKGSGLAFTDFEIFQVQQDTLYVIDRFLGMNLPDSTNKTQNLMYYHYDTVETHLVSDQLREELAEVITKTDTLGTHTALGCIFIMGWPRFLIYTNYNGKEMDGYVANCYRGHIYPIVDVFNKIYPRGDVLTYNKDELIAQEADCTTRLLQDFKRYQEEKNK